MPVVGLADGLVEGLVLDVKQASPMEGARRDGRSVPAPDKLREKIMGLLTVGNVSKGAVLPLEEHAGMHQHADEKPRLALGKTKGRNGVDPFRASAVAEVAQAHGTHRNFSATRGSNDRPPLPLRPPQQLQPARLR